ncbi:hypothetical protein PPUJ20028_32360 [Pseudomonas putida]|uniref:Aldehyde dehydrogenase domain-containing protein n=1 Tax=Pseudomonas putida TaxID=303 RepID=A0AA37R8G0_PSEPU|nr:hypothetical protein PPUJ20028_32360 [Pseudomonas putida]GLO34980.1 hypothetical protein PPUN14671_18130 [Pseudomonas putida]HDS0963536.1 aldehyde dehydrogenase family protein [Pseudomonas putida]HDS0988795.1 aldehyde dehydrogenase family protein [Pseudomonas putida]
MTLVTKSSYVDGAFVPLVGNIDILENRNPSNPGEVVERFERASSEHTGRQIARLAAEGMKKAQLEIGGKNPLIVLDDADLEQAVEVALNGSFYSTGQRCTASSRVIVTEGIHDAFIARQAEHFKRNSSAGMVMVNLPTAGVDYHVPFGGNGASSLGSREQGTHARQFFTRVKTTYQLA